MPAARPGPSPSLCERSIGAIWLTSHDSRKPAEEQHFGGPSLGEDLHASVRCWAPLEGRIGIAHQAIQVREVGCRHGENLSVLVDSPPKKFRLPGGRCDVEPPRIAVAADEQIEYGGLRRHRGERSIRAGVLSLEAWWIDALQSGGRTCGPSSRRVPKGAWGSRSSRRTSSSPSSESWLSRLPSSSCAFRSRATEYGRRPSGNACRLRASERGDAASWMKPSRRRQGSRSSMAPSWSRCARMPNAPSRSTSGPQMSRIISTVHWPSTSERRYAARASSGRNGSPSAVLRA